MKLERPTIIALTCLFAFMSAAAASARAASPLSVSSPDGNLTVSLELKNNPQPYLPGERAYYRVTYKGVPVLNDSPLGLDFLGARPLDQDLEIVGVERTSNDSTWENRFGPRRVVPDRYNQLSISLRERHAPGRRVVLVFRAYDEGVAFRYVVPKQEGMEKFALASEDTGFYFARDASAFALNMGRFNTHNEGEYVRTRLDEIKPAWIVNLPAGRRDARRTVGGASGGGPDQLCRHVRGRRARHPERPGQQALDAAPEGGPGPQSDDRRARRLRAAGGRCLAHDDAVEGC